MRGIVWFREDLRTHDNPALYHATQHCKEGVIAVYLIDTKMWQQHHVAACRKEFILRGLTDLQAELAKLNVPCLVLNVTESKNIPQQLATCLDKYKAKTLFFNRQYEVNESRRDATVTQYLSARDITCYSYDDQVILPPGSVQTQQGTSYSVFTPYKRAWQKNFASQTIKTLPVPKKQIILPIQTLPVPSDILTESSAIDPNLWPTGQKAAQKKLDFFIANHLLDYDKTRDFPALDSTSKLSPYLSSGMISARQCFLAALAENHNELDTGNKGVTTWLGELIWREFYKHLLVAVPRVSMGQPYKLETANIVWDYNAKMLEAWQQGKTGYPIIDAAMRQLNTTGWMHNRLRMVVAMFLTKNLFFDWHLGEEYFALQLIDGDLAANNGGWQWSASTGTDSAPYFRIFNPIRQSQRFDPEGIFIRRYCPELATLNNKQIHEPHKLAPQLAKNCGYPEPIIDLNAKRSRVLAAFAGKNKAAPLQARPYGKY